jgi:hypothetical protein
MEYISKQTDNTGGLFINFCNLFYCTSIRHTIGMTNHQCCWQRPAWGKLLCCICSEQNSALYAYIHSNTCIIKWLILQNKVSKLICVWNLKRQSQKPAKILKSALGREPLTCTGPFKWLKNILFIENNSHPRCLSHITQW